MDVFIAACIAASMDLFIAVSVGEFIAASIAASIGIFSALPGDYCEAATGD